MPDPRLQSIYFHAGRLFNTKRYANTRVTEIAAAAGIATGTVYNLFTGKKAILTFVLRGSLDPAYLSGEPELPVAETDAAYLLTLFSRQFDKLFHEILQIADADGKVVRGFTQMLADLFDIEADILLALNIIEYNADILPDLAHAFFPARQRFLVRLESNLRTYMELGEVRQLDFPNVHVQSINDILTWWAMNAYIAMPGVSVPRETARATAVDLVARAYLAKYGQP